MSKYDDYHKVDNRYTTAIGMSSWRFFNQKVKDVCYFNPFYVAWCLESWQGFSLTSYERSNYMKGLERQLEKDFIKEISGKVYVKAGTDSVDVINLQTRRTKRYKVQYT